MKIIKEAIEKQVKLFNFKVSAADMNIIKSNAQKYYGGNVSGWIKYSSKNYKPTKKELTTI